MNVRSAKVFPNQIKLIFAAASWGIGFAATTCGADTIPEPALERLRAAHSLPFAFVVPTKSIAVNIDADAEQLCRSRPGWWNVSDSFVDPVSGKILPVCAVGRCIIDEQGVVFSEQTPLAGPPEFQRPLRQIIAPTFWVQQHHAEDAQATIIYYKRITPSASLAARRAGRLPHIDLWGPQVYATLVLSVLEQLGAADDAVAVSENEYVAVTSSRLGITAWIGNKGELEAARLALTGGVQRRYEFHGVAAENWFPARFPAECRVYEVVGGPDGRPNESLSSIELYDRPEALKESDRHLLDPAGLGMRLVEPHPASVPGASIAGIPIGVRSGTRNLVLLVITVFAVFVLGAAVSKRLRR